MDGVASNGRKRKRSTHNITRSDSESDTGDEELAASDAMDLDEEEEPGHSASNPVVIIEDSAPPPPKPTPQHQPTVGGALKRNADGSIAAPKMLARKDKGQRVRISIICAVYACLWV